MRILFLDFDGCLHSAHALNAPFCHAPWLARALRRFPDVKVVVTTSHRVRLSIEQIRVLLGKLGDRVIDATPDLREEKVRGRQREIEAWLKKHPCDDFVVLDDQAVLFEPGWPPLILCPARTGLDDRSLNQLIVRLQGYRS